MFITKALAAEQTGILGAIDGFIPGGIENIFLVGLGIGAILAVGTIIFAGIKYSMSGDNASKQKDAREWIWAAVKGLALIAGGAVIIAIINPNALNVQNIALNRVPLINEQDGDVPTMSSPALGITQDPDTGDIISVGDAVTIGDEEIVITAAPGGMTAEEFADDLERRAANMDGVESVTNNSSGDNVMIIVAVEEGADAQVVANELLAGYLSPSSPSAGVSGTPGQGAPSHPYPGHWIQRGDTGEEVKWIQEKLDITVDGKFGPQTEAAVENFQIIKGVQSDGIVGPITWGLLFGTGENSTPAPSPSPTPGDEPSAYEITTMPILSKTGKKVGIGSVYGWRYSPSSNCTRMHNGVDFSDSCSRKSSTGVQGGENLYAVATGTVSHDSNSSCGCALYLNYKVGNDKYRAIYCHIEKANGKCHYATSSGATVSVGQVIAYAGNTGRSSCPHLHFGLRKNGSYINVNYMFDESYSGLASKKTSQEKKAANYSKCN